MRPLANNPAPAAPSEESLSDSDHNWWYPTKFHPSLGAPAPEGERDLGDTVHGDLLSRAEEGNDPLVGSERGTLPMPSPANGKDSLSEKELESPGRSWSTAPDRTPQPRHEQRPVCHFTYNTPGVPGEIPISTPWAQ